MQVIVVCKNDFPIGVALDQKGVDKIQETELKRCTNNLSEEQKKTHLHFHTHTFEL
jgi:hypothetical protein